MQFKCGSWLACVRIAAVSLKDRIGGIARKPAPTKDEGCGLLRGRQQEAGDNR